LPSFLITKRAADEGDSPAGNTSEEVRRLDAEIGRLMDLLQHDQLASVGEIADAIAKAHAERMRLLPRSSQKPRLFDVEGFKVILRDVAYGYADADLRGRRAFLLQLIDRVQIDTRGVIRVVWAL
jgi:hypothetical protein